MLKRIDDVFPTHGDATYGIVLRDWLAAMAMQGELSGQTIEFSYSDEEVHKLADFSYLVADAMIERGNK